MDVPLTSTLAERRSSFRPLLSGSLAGLGLGSELVRSTVLTLGAVLGTLVLILLVRGMGAGS